MTDCTEKNIIPIFFAVDDNYAPYLAVVLESIKETAGENNFYDINVLIERLSDEHMNNILAMQEDNIKIRFCDVTEKVNELCEKLHLRDYYTRATYYRFFIPDMFPQYDKGLYLDCDLAITRDVADMYNTELGDNLLGAIPEEFITNIGAFGRYSEVVLGVPRAQYFNAGILVMNLAEMRRIHIESIFADLLSKKTFQVAQDQDYLNVICLDKVVYLSQLWNKTPMPFADKNITPYIAHYKINFKPWKFHGVIYGELFWKYAKKTPYYGYLISGLENTTDEERKISEDQYFNLEKRAIKETEEELERLDPRDILPEDVDHLKVVDSLYDYQPMEA